MNTVQLECFISVAKHLNFSKAAEELRITQPAVSHQIHTLESELEAPLFHRTSKSVSITPQGALFLPDAEQMLKIAASARDRLADRDQPLMLEIGCHNASEAALLPEALRRLRLEYPTLRPAIQLIPFESLTSRLEGRQIRLMFGFKNDYKKTVLHYRELFQCPLVCICSRNHPLAGHTTLTSNELQGSIVLCEPSQATDTIFQIQNSVAARCAPRDRYFGEGTESALILVKAEIGYTLFPDIPLARDPGLCYIPVTDLPKLSFGVYCRVDSETPLIRRFQTLLVEAAKPYLSEAVSQHASVI